MKFLSSITLMSMPFLVSSQPAAYWDGNNDAAELWDTKPYECTLRGVVSDFWTDVKRQVFPQCKRKYNIFPRSLQQCKDGAEAYTTARANDCAKVYECKVLGDIAAESVADKYCPRRPLAKASRFRKEPPSLIPRRCERKAKDQCRYVVGGIVGDRIDDGTCKSLSLPLRSSLKRKLKKQCYEVVRDLVDQAALP